MLLAISACQRSGPQLGQVSGTITLNGTPFQGASVTFIPQEGTNVTSTGHSDQNGRYTMHLTFREKGVVVGHHDVTIEYSPTDRFTEVSADSNQATKSSNVIPSKYAKRGELTANVQPGKQTLDFALVSESGK